MPQTRSSDTLLPAGAAQLSARVSDALMIERVSFGAKVRAARAVLGLSQEELAAQIGLTQKSVHRIEQGSVEPKLRTMLTIQQFWSESGISFDDTSDGGFRLLVRSAALLRK